MDIHCLSSTFSTTVYGINAIKNCVIDQHLSLAAKIQALVLNILLMIPAFFADLLNFCSRQVTPPQVYELPPQPIFEPPVPEIPQDHRIERLLTRTVGNANFENALLHSFACLDRATVDTYKELIENEGVPDEGDPPIDIYKWVAECHIVHLLRSGAAGAAIQNIFDDLNPRDRAIVCLKIIDVNYERELNQMQMNLLRAIQAFSGDYTRTPAFRDAWRQIDINNL